MQHWLRCKQLDVCSEYCLLRLGPVELIAREGTEKAKDVEISWLL